MYRWAYVCVQRFMHEFFFLSYFVRGGVGSRATGHARAKVRRRLRRSRVSCSPLTTDKGEAVFGRKRAGEKGWARRARKSYGRGWGGVRRVQVGRECGYSRRGGGRSPVRVRVGATRELLPVPHSTLSLLAANPSSALLPLLLLPLSRLHPPSPSSPSRFRITASSLPLVYLPSSAPLSRPALPSSVHDNDILFSLSCPERRVLTRGARVSPGGVAGGRGTRRGSLRPFFAR